MSTVRKNCIVTQKSMPKQFWHAFFIKMSIVRPGFQTSRNVKVV